nr:uncharacterized protein LOC120968064 isoform X1 [Aegilops tauschii subsp. strangulata]XP_045086654.1 uncharacterized protein LOC123494684 isoform X1 [Aegilops tauschii subsp. strangulata]
MHVVSRCYKRRLMKIILSNQQLIWYNKEAANELEKISVEMNKSGILMFHIYWFLVWQPMLVDVRAPNMEAASVRKIKGCIATVKTFSGRPTTRMSLLLSWHPTLADVTQKGVLKLMNLDGLTVYNTNDHVQVHELENFLRFVHTFRFVFQVKIRKPTAFLLCFRKKLDLFGRLLQPSV